MILFLISFLMVFISSYLITSIITPKKSILGVIYLFLIAFAQLILTFEALSLFNLIKEIPVLLSNLAFLFVSLYLWNKYDRPFWNLEYKNFFRRVFNSFKLDKTLIILFIGFSIFISSALILCTIMPITNADAQAYHVARSLFWVLQGSLNHFEVSDIRNLCLPINSEILYSWVILFIKKDVFLGFFSFVGYLLSIISIYNILGYLGYCVRKRLWVIFILSSFSSLIVQVSGTETDIIIAGLITSCIFLFWNSLKTGNKVPLFMASLAYAIAIGTKTPAVIMIPGTAVLMAILCFYYKKYKPFWLFLGFGIINFVVFSSFNYILNFIHFNNFMGSSGFITVSKNYYGIKGMAANFVKFIFMFFDFTGFLWGDYLNSYIQHGRSLTLNLFHLSYVYDGLYSLPYTANRILVEPIMGSGILGFLVFIPCLLWAFIKPIFKKRALKTKFLLAFAVVFIINLLSISYTLAYMSYSVRFVMAFMVVSSPILLYSYFSNKNPLKYIIIAFSVFYLAGVSTHLWARPLINIFKILKLHPSITYLREISVCKTYTKNPQMSNAVCALRSRIEQNLKGNKKILAFMNSSNCIYILKSLEFKGYTIDLRNMEDAYKINFKNYDLVIIPSDGQVSTIIKDYEKRKNNYKIIGNKVTIFNKETVPCFYVRNPLIPNSQKQPPYSARCVITNDFIRENNLKLISVAGVLYRQLKNSEYYFIYKNK